MGPGGTGRARRKTRASNACREAQRTTRETRNDNMALPKVRWRTSVKHGGRQKSTNDYSTVLALRLTPMTRRQVADNPNRMSVQVRSLIQCDYDVARIYLGTLRTKQERNERASWEARGGRDLRTCGGGEIRCLGGRGCAIRAVSWIHCKDPFDSFLVARTETRCQRGGCWHQGRRSWDED